MGLITRSGSARSRTGSAMVEMAIVLPILLMLFFAIAEFSVLFLRWQAVTNSAREGAREASLFRPNCTLTVQNAVTQAVTGVLSPVGLSPSALNMSGACASPGSTTVTVTVPYQFQVLPAFAGGLGAPINLSATSVMRNEF